MDDADIAEKDRNTMFTELQRRRIRLDECKVDPTEQRHCVICDCIIPLKRLLAVPNTKYCINCLRRIENELNK